MIDLDALDAAIAESERRNMFTAPIVKELIAELRERREQVDGYRMMIDGLENAAHEERAAVVAYLSECAQGGDTFGPRGSGDHLRLLATNIQRGWHRREEEEE